MTRAVASAARMTEDVVVQPAHAIRRSAMTDDLPAEVEALRKVPFFENLIPEDLERVARIGERRTYGEGSPMVSRGDEPGTLFVILSGTARVEAGGKVHTLGPGDFFGEMAMLGETRRSATVTAAEPVEAMIVEAIHFRPFLVKNPSVAVAILEGVVARLREVQDRIDSERSG
jgi:CRP-like cAMP-binding protein